MNCPPSLSLSVPPSLYVPLCVCQSVRPCLSRSLSLCLSSFFLSLSLSVCPCLVSVSFYVMVPPEALHLDRCIPVGSVWTTETTVSDYRIIKTPLPCSFPVSPSFSVYPSVYLSSPQAGPMSCAPRQCRNFKKIWGYNHFSG